MGPRVLGVSVGSKAGAQDSEEGDLRRKMMIMMEQIPVSMDTHWHCNTVIGTWENTSALSLSLYLNFYFHSDPLEEWDGSH